DGLARGMRERAVLEALDALARGSSPIGVVWGSGFEDRPAILETVAQRWMLLGNQPQTVVRAKNPMIVADLCDAHNIPRPEVAHNPPAVPSGWLIKRRGGAGGIHVQPACNSIGLDQDSYFQRRHNGFPISVLILADGRDAAVIGLSSQWPAPNTN